MYANVVLEARKHYQTPISNTTKFTRREREREVMIRILPVYGKRMRAFSAILEVESTGVINIHENRCGKEEKRASRGAEKGIERQKKKGRRD